MPNTPLDLAEIPDHDDNHDPANEPANDAGCELTSAEPADPALSAASSLLPQESLVRAQKTIAIYPNDPFIHVLYGGFLGMSELPGAPQNSDRWATFIEAYVNPDLSHYFALSDVPSA
jgi:hypothetical protein